MIEIVKAKATGRGKQAKQPWHVRVVAAGNSEPILAGETLTSEEAAGESVAALGRLFSPVDRAEYAAGALTVWLDHDELGEKLHIPVELVDEDVPAPVPAEAPSETEGEAS